MTHEEARGQIIYTLKLTDSEAQAVYAVLQTVLEMGVLKDAVDSDRLKSVVRKLQAARVAAVIELVAAENATGQKQ